MKKLFCFSMVIVVNQAMAWGELGHHLIARQAAKLIAAHPLVTSELARPTAAKNKLSLESFLLLFADRRYQEGHLANIPDIYWKSIGGEEGEEVKRLGNPTHFLDLDRYPGIHTAEDLFKVKIPLNYATAKTVLHESAPKTSMFREVGSLPWRAQQFANLFKNALEKYPKGECKNSKEDSDSPTRTALTYAGLLAHFTGDVSQPLHSTLDHDAALTGQRGLHWYFENHLVNALEDGLEEKVNARALEYLQKAPAEGGTVGSFRAKAAELYPNLPPDNEVTAMMLVFLADSFTLVEKLRKTDALFAVATWEEAWQLPSCQNLPSVKAAKVRYEKLTGEAKPALAGERAFTRSRENLDYGKGEEACRRVPSTRVNDKGQKEDAPGSRTVAQWHEDLIVDRLALSAAFTADLWVRTWFRAGSPSLCPQAQYALKPSFVSPSEKSCLGYAPEESTASGKKAKKGSSPCLSF